MTRKDYERIAESLRFARHFEYAESDAERMWRRTGFSDALTAIADAMAADNGRFDRSRFYRACGMDGQS